jgi:hypothetical protein
MGKHGAQGSVLVLLLGVLSSLWAGKAVAQPGSGPRETVDQGFTTTQPNSPTGQTYSGVYHAAGDPQGNPPYLRRMVFYPPAGMHYDTSVPGQCSASDAELQLRGPDACPPDSRLGDATVEGLFFVPFSDSIVFDHYQHHVDLMNNANEQILLVQSEGFTVVRGRLQPDGSWEFDTPTCFPAPPTGQCADDYILQLKTSSSIPAYTKTVAGRLLSYITTPPTCPASGLWQTTIRFWWADGSTDTVVSNEPCARPAGQAASRPSTRRTLTRHGHRHRASHRHRSG